MFYIIEFIYAISLYIILIAKANSPVLNVYELYDVKFSRGLKSTSKITLAALYFIWMPIWEYDYYLWIIYGTSLEYFFLFCYFSYLQSHSAIFNLFYLFFFLLFELKKKHRSTYLYHHPSKVVYTSKCMMHTHTHTQIWWFLIQ